MLQPTKAERTFASQLLHRGFKGVVDVVDVVKVGEGRTTELYCTVYIQNRIEGCIDERRVSTRTWRSSPVHGYVALLHPVPNNIALVSHANGCPLTGPDPRCLPISLKKSVIQQLASPKILSSHFFDTRHHSTLKPRAHVQLSDLQSKIASK